MKKTRNMLLTAFALFAAVAMTTNTAEAGRFGLSLNFGGHRHYSGHRGHGYRDYGFSRRGYGGYNRWDCYQGGYGWRGGRSYYGRDFDRGRGRGYGHHHRH